MVLLLTCLVFFSIAFLGFPLAYALVASVFILTLGLSRGYPIEAILITYLDGIEGLHYVAVPLFILAGELISRGGVGRRIIAFAQSLVGWAPGGLSLVTVVSCLFFGAVSGSAVACAAAIGTIMIPAMTKHGYACPFSAALIASAGTLGVIIPPSIPLLIYAFLANVSVAQLFVASVLPGLVFGVGLMVVSFLTARRNGWDVAGEPPDLRTIARTFVQTIPAVAMPVIILGGIYSGYFTPTEAAAVAVVYGLAIALFLYREITFRDLPGIILDSFIVSGVVMMVIGASACVAWFITVEQIARELTGLITNFSDNKYVFLIMLNVALVFVGIFIEPLPALILTAPLFIPTALQFGVDPLHLGVLITCNLAIGLYTPPVGGTLFVAAKIGKVGMLELSRSLMPIFYMSIVVLALITFIPELSLMLPRLLQ